MKTYWDTSSLIVAMHEMEARRRLEDSESWTRSHTLAESFSVLTGGRMGVRYIGSDAAEMIASAAERLKIVDLDKAEILEALKAAEKLGVRGGGVHDLLHKAAAEKCGALLLLTEDRDFSLLKPKFKVDTV